MNSNYERLVAEYLNAPEARSTADRLEFMKISRLDRIADALERINEPGSTPLRRSPEIFRHIETKNPLTSAPTLARGST